MKTDIDTLPLLEKVKAGSDDAFAQLAEKYRTVTEALVSSFIGTSDRDEDPDTLADDLRQEARLALYRAAKNYDAEGDGKAVTFGLYAKICIKNALISDSRRRERHRRKMERLRRTVTQGTDRSDNAAEAVMSRMELDEVTRRADMILSPYEMRIFRELTKGRSAKDIAPEIGRSAKSVNNAIYRIKVKLKGMMT